MPDPQQVFMPVSRLAQIPPDIAATPELGWLHRVAEPLRPAIEPREAFQARISFTPLPRIDPFPIAIGRRVSHRQWQFPLTVPQGARGTCWAFAGIAALEGAYARQGIREKLSEQYLFSVVKAHENQVHGNTLHSLMGFGGGAGVVRLMRHLAVPPAALCAYIDEAPLKTLADSIPQTGMALTPAGGGSKDQADWLEFDLRNVPAAARWNASYRPTAYGTVAGTVDALRKTISDGHDVLVDVLVVTPGQPKAQWGGHVVLLIGFDDNTRTFEIKNPWGTPGFGTMAYENDPQFVLSGANGYYITSVAPAAPQWAAMWVGRWQMDHDGWLGRLTIRRFTDIQTENTALPAPAAPVPIGTWYGEGGQFHTVTGGFVDGGRGLVAFINGQKFELRVHGRDPWRAAGRCWSNGQPYGVILRRGPTLGAGAGFDRAETIGLWDMVHDGWFGQLRIGASPSYVSGVEGTASAVEIAPAPVAHKVDAAIAFAQPPQPFQLLVHTREDGLFGGTTAWGNASWPVEGRMSTNFYAVADDGTLRWYRHTGRAARKATWDDPKPVGSGWQQFAKVIGGGDGVIYAIRNDGALLWYYHEGRNQGTTAWLGPREVGSGWNGFSRVLAGDAGTIYAVRPDGRLLWYRHLGRRDGSMRWLGPVEVGSGWGGFTALATGPDNSLYAAAADGSLYWYRHDGADHGFPIWQGPVRVGSGWQPYKDIWVAGGGYVYGRTAGGALWMWRHHGYRTGRAEWTEAKRVGSGWRAGIRHVLLT